MFQKKSIKMKIESGKTKILDFESLDSNKGSSLLMQVTNNDEHGVFIESTKQRDSTLDIYFKNSSDEDFDGVLEIQFVVFD